ncbi:Hypothetical protein CINCED_3A000702 [Cinara cedri]|uniref:Uncharacterized protein n=1 Tax=Cinara cedri TaxID=506608 RepID=A0A5E4MPS9_9HEMI|nr:Hypothetical protein CINCED_3A000702 [Cinara cedri]
MVDLWCSQHVKYSVLVINFLSSSDGAPFRQSLQHTVVQRTGLAVVFVRTRSPSSSPPPPPRNRRVARPRNAHTCPSGPTVDCYPLSGRWFFGAIRVEYYYLPTSEYSAACGGEHPRQIIIFHAATDPHGAELAEQNIFPTAEKKTVPNSCC